MSQVTDYIITPTTINMTNLAIELQEMFAAAASANRGSTAPTNPFEGMFWWDSSANPELLKRYTVTAGWVTLVSVNITTGAMVISGYVLNSLFTANTILAATTSATPAALTIPEQTMVGRITGGNIKALSVAEVNTLLGGSSLPWALITDVKASGVDGGDADGGTSELRTLNTITGSEGSGNQTWCTLATNSMKFSTGTYLIEASAPAFNVNTHQCFLYNAGIASVILRGTSEFTNGYASNRSFLKGLFTVTSADHAYYLYHYIQSTNAGDGLGRGGAFGSGLFSSVFIQKYS